MADEIQWDYSGEIPQKVNEPTTQQEQEWRTPGGATLQDIGETAYKFAATGLGAPIDLASVFTEPLRAALNLPKTKPFLGREYMAEQGQKAGLLESAEFTGADDLLSFFVPDPTSVLSAVKIGSTAMAGMMIPAKADLSKKSSDFISVLQNTIESSPQSTYTKEQLVGMLSPQKGIKAEEMKWSGLQDYLDTLPEGAKVSKEEVLSNINNPQLNKTVLQDIKNAGVSNIDLSDWEVSSLYGESIYKKNILGKEYTIAETGDSRFPYAVYDERDLVGNAADLEMAATQINRDLQWAGKLDKPETKYRDYSTKDIGGTNYREELTTLDAKTTKEEIELNRLYDEIAESQGTPNAITRSNPKYKRYLELKEVVEKQQGGKTSYNSSHWDERNVLYHVRKQDVNLSPSKSYALEMENKRKAEGRKMSELTAEEKAKYQELKNQPDEKVLLIEEIQSDWHQEGRKKGYDTPENKEKINAKKAEIQANLDLIKSEKEWLSDFMDKTRSETKEKNWSLYDALDAYGQRDRFDKYQELIKKSTALNRELEDLSYLQIKAIPQAPYSKTWHEKAMKDQIAEAVNKGYDRVAWVAGREQADRYSLSQSVNYINVERDDPEHLFAYINFKNNDDVAISYDSTGKIYDSEHLEYKGKNISDLVGKEMADEMLSVDSTKKFEGEGLEIGGEGMKAFYDEMLPKSTSKYIKKYGSKVEISTLPNGQKVWSFKVTDKMKKDIGEKGQSLYAHPATAVGAGAVGYGAYEAQNENNDTFTFNDGVEDITIPLNGKSPIEAIDEYYNNMD